MFTHDFAAVADKALGCIDGRHPGRYGRLRERTEASIRYEAVVGGPACAEHDGPTGCHNGGGLCASQPAQRECRKRGT